MWIMTLPRATTTFVILTLVLVGCSLIDTADATATQSPAPTTTISSSTIYEGIGGRRIRIEDSPRPEFIVTIVIYTERFFYPEEMCTEINYLWEDIDTTGSLYDHYASKENYSIYVDNLPAGDIFLEGGLFEYIAPPGDEHKSSADLNYCFNTANLEAGVHNASIHLFSPSGHSYAYSWKFEIVGG